MPGREREPIRTPLTSPSGHRPEKRAFMLEKTRRCHGSAVDDSYAPRWLRGPGPAAVRRRWRAVTSALLATLGWLGPTSPAAAADDPSPEIGHAPELWPHLFPLLGKG